MAPPMRQTNFTRAVLRIVEPIVFARRAITLGVLTVLSIVFAISASQLKPQAGWLKMVPQTHPYMQTFLEYYKDFGGANTVLVAMKHHQGDIYQPEFMESLRQVGDDVFFIPGVDRARVTSIFSPGILYIEVIEDGLAGAPVIPANYQPTPEMMDRIRINVGKANVVGRLVSEDQTAALIAVELLENDPETNLPLDYVKVGDKLEEIRAKYETGDVTVHIIGFAKVVDDMTDASIQVASFFIVALFLMGALLWIYVGSLTMAAIVCATSLVACVWELGLLNLIGFGLDPFALLVPFLIMAVSVSHGVQYVSSWANEITSKGATSYQASLATFRALAIPGVVALLANVVGFSTIYLINIDVIREMSINAAFGMVGVIMVNKMLLPAVLSYLKIPNVEKFKAATELRERLGDTVFKRMAVLCRKGPAIATITVCAVLAGFGAHQLQYLRIGDTTEGVPELRPDSRFNKDAAVVAGNFAMGVDQLKVVAETKPDACIDYSIMSEIDRFSWYMYNQDGVRDVLSLLDLAKLAYEGLNEGRPSAEVLPRNRYAMAQSTALVPTSTGFLNDNCDALALFIFTRDHKADTIEQLIRKVKHYQEKMNQEPRVTFRLATGNVGVMAATNEVVKANELPIVIWVYGAIMVFLFLSFRTMSGVFCIILPLSLVTLLGYSVMVALDIGQKVATLPVLAFACGIGVDYGIYSYAVIADGLRRGLTLEEAYYQKMRSTGKATLFTGLGLAAGVAMWIFSELQFQRDMGILLVFGFTANMIGAIVVLPALAFFLADEEKKHAGQDLMAGADAAMQENAPKAAKT